MISRNVFCVSRCYSKAGGLKEKAGGLGTRSQIYSILQNERRRLRLQHASRRRVLRKEGATVHPGIAANMSTQLHATYESTPSAQIPASMRMLFLLGSSQANVLAPANSLRLSKMRCERVSKFALHSHATLVRRPNQLETNAQFFCLLQWQVGLS